MTKFGTTLCALNGPNTMKLRYIQPPVREMIRPPISYKRPTIPIDCETVHKTSFVPIDRDVALQCRLPAAIPEPNLNMNRDVKIDTETVTSISFPPFVGVQKNLTMIPPSRIVMGTGPMEKMTTQKHDYVLKRCQRRGPINPLHGMTPSTEPIESDTTTRLSFAPPAGFIPVQNCKPNVVYQQPDIDMDLKTCHKQSFQSPHTRPREIPAWAVKPPSVKPMIPIDAVTTQKCSYPPPGVVVEYPNDDGADNNNQLASVEYYARAGLWSSLFNCFFFLKVYIDFFLYFNIETYIRKFIKSLNANEAHVSQRTHAFMCRVAYIESLMCPALSQHIN